MTHLSRLSEELILWMSPRFGFIDIADRFCTGSSIMPQKKNPDVPELVRGKTGRVNGHLVALLTLMKGQPLAYNKDNQEDKEPLFDTVDTLVDTLVIYAEMMRGVTVKADRMRAAAAEGFATASALPTAAAASIDCRWAPQPWPARHSRSTAKRWRTNSALNPSAKIRWTPCPTAISPSNSVPPQLW